MNIKSHIMNSGNSTAPRRATANTCGRWHYHIWLIGALILSVPELNGAVVPSLSAFKITSQSGPLITCFSNILVSGPTDASAHITVSVNGRSLYTNAFWQSSESFAAILPLMLGTNLITIDEVTPSVTNSALTVITRVSAWSSTLFHDNLAISAITNGYVIMDVSGRNVIGFIPSAHDNSPWPGLRMAVSERGSIVAVMSVFQGFSFTEIIDVPRDRILATSGISFVHSASPDYIYYFGQDGQLFGLNSQKLGPELLAIGVPPRLSDWSAFAVSPSRDIWYSDFALVDNAWGFTFRRYGHETGPLSCSFEAASLEAPTIEISSDGRWIGVQYFAFAIGSLQIFSNAPDLCSPAYSDGFGDFPADLILKTSTNGGLRAYTVSSGNSGAGNNQGGIDIATFDPAAKSWSSNPFVRRWDYEDARLAVSADQSMLALPRLNLIEFIPIATNAIAWPAAWELATAAPGGAVSFVRQTDLVLPPPILRTEFTSDPHYLRAWWFPIGGTLQIADSVYGPWRDLGTENPCLCPIGPQQQAAFFRVRQ